MRVGYKCYGYTILIIRNYEFTAARYSVMRQVWVNVKCKCMSVCMCARVYVCVESNRKIIKKIKNQSNLLL